MVRSGRVDLEDRVDRCFLAVLEDRVDRCFQTVRRVRVGRVDRVGTDCMVEFLPLRRRLEVGLVFLGRREHRERPACHWGRDYRDVQGGRVCSILRILRQPDA